MQNEELFKLYDSELALSDDALEAIVDGGMVNRLTISGKVFYETDVSAITLGIGHVESTLRAVSPPGSLKT